MATTTAYAFPGTVTSTAGWAADSGTLVTCLASSDDVRATHAAAAVDGDYLECTNFGFSLPAGAVVTSAELHTEDITASLLKAGEVPMTGAYLTLNGTSNTGVEKTWLTTQSSLPGADGTQTVTWSGLSLTAAQVNASTFGVRIHRGTDTTPPDIGAESGRAIDVVKLRLTYSIVPGGEEEDTMDLYMTGKQGGVECLLTEAVPAISSSTSIFANVPDGTIYVEFEFRSQNAYINWSGTATTSAGGGILYTAGTVYRRPLTKEKATTVKAIEAGATATGTIAYFGIPKS